MNTKVICVSIIHDDRQGKFELDLRDFWRIHDGFEVTQSFDTQNIRERLKTNKEDSLCGVPNYAGTSKTPGFVS